MLHHRLLQVIRQDLRAADAEGRNDHPAAGLARLGDDPDQPFLHPAHIVVAAVGVRALGDEIIGCGQGRRGVAQDRLAGAAQVAGVEQPHGGRAVEFHQDDRRAQEVPGLQERGPQAVAQADGGAVVGAREERLRGLGVGDAVERLDLLLGPRGPLGVPELGIFLLDMGRVGQHDAAQVGRGRRRVNPPAEPLPHQARQVAAVVDVGVREEDRLQVGRREGERLVPPSRLVAVPLHQAAIQRHHALLKVQQVHRPGHRLSGAVEFQFSHTRPPSLGTDGTIVYLKLGTCNLKLRLCHCRVSPSHRRPRGRIMAAHAPIAQMDRALDYGSKGCRFDSCWAHSRKSPPAAFLSRAEGRSPAACPA